MAIPSQDLKKCRKCQQVKTHSEFYPRKTPFGHGLTSECRECTKKRSRKYVEDNYEIVRKKSRAYLQKKYAITKAAVFSAYGGYVCACCGETERAFLSLDHINNDGAEFRRMIAGKRTAAGQTTYRWLERHNFPEGFQVLCMNCQHGKRMCGGICPHQVRCNDQAKAVESSDSKRSAPVLTGEDMASSASKDAAA
jgi:hypothetical protein